MKKLALGVSLFLGGLLALTLSAQDVDVTQEKPSVVVGIFDSRAVATAYMRSERFREVIAGMRKELEEAKDTGNAERAAELEAQGPEMQHQGHLQVFGSAPIPNVLAIIKDDLAGVATDAGVDVMVSKWRLAYEGPRARYVDVTDRLVELFEPDMETLEVIEQLRNIAPVPAEELEKHDH